jgi:hypothetical protein
MANQKSLLIALVIIFLCYGTGTGPLAAQCSSGKVCTCSDCPEVERTYRQGRWFVLESANFQVCCDSSNTSAIQLARHTEKLRITLREKWLDDARKTIWRPKCQLVLHSSRSSYTSAVGRGSERTFGSSLVSIEKGRISGRRIDLLGASDQDYFSAALPHELTHVVLRDRFVETGLPRWADEGVAMLADTKEKRGRHNKDLLAAVRRDATFNVPSLLLLEEYPPADRWGAFYGQSISLTEFLVHRKTPEEFVNFIERAKVKGYDAALEECYGIANMGDLDRQWRRQWAE